MNIQAFPKLTQEKIAARKAALAEQISLLREGLNALEQDMNDPEVEQAEMYSDREYLGMCASLVKVNKILITKLAMAGETNSENLLKALDLLKAEKRNG